MGNSVEKQDILNVAKFLGMGFYRVKENGAFLEADPIARDIFGIPRGDETDLSTYSIEKLYIFPAERKLRIDKLNESGCTPISGTLSIRVNGKNMLLFDLCWCDDGPDCEICFAGLVRKIEGRVISPEMFDELPLGVYELDDENKLVYFNKKAMNIFGYHESEEDNLLKRNIAEFYDDLEALKKFSEKVREKGYAQDILKFRNAKSEVIELECFTEHINEFKMARWGIIHDVTERQRYFRALDKMPTGYYYIRYTGHKKRKHYGKIVFCNDQFAKIMGVENKDMLIGRDVEEFYADPAEGKRYFELLDKKDEGGKPVLDYTFSIIRADNKKIVYISVDSHLVKENRKVIGREGTIRDITERVELERVVEDTKSRLVRLTADINSLIHTFLHPVLKAAGHSELFHELGRILYKSIKHRTMDKIGLLKLGKELEKRLLDIKEELNDISGFSESAVVLRPKFAKIVNILDYNLDQGEMNDIMLDNAIQDAALRVFEDLDQTGFFNENIKKGLLEDVITDEFVNYLQNILFGYLIRTSKILKGETQMMMRGVEALREYINLGEKKTYSFKPHNLGRILQENIELFKPILAHKEVEIEYQITGNLDARMSKNDIDRVVCNLFHNACKYSDKGPRRFVKIRAKELQQEKILEFSINNCGVPITKHEIENGDIFKFGYRSRLVYKSDRDGTGVGLADAKDVIEAHGGKITVTSEPMRDDGEPPQYEVPYITTVTVRLPKSPKKENKK